MRRLEKGSLPDEAAAMDKTGSITAKMLPPASADTSKLCQSKKPPIVTTIVTPEITKSKQQSSPNTSQYVPVLSDHTATANIARTHTNNPIYSNTSFTFLQTSK